MCPPSRLIEFSWTLIFSTISNGSGSDVLWEQIDSTGSPAQATASGYGHTYQTVTGSSTQDPQWSSLFAALSYTPYDQGSSQSITIPAHKTARLELRYDKQTGEEAWSQNDESCSFWHGAPSRISTWDASQNQR